MILHYFFAKKDSEATRDSAADTINDLIDNFRDALKLDNDQVAPLRYVALQRSRLLNYLPKNWAQPDTQMVAQRLGNNRGNARKIADQLIDELRRLAKKTEQDVAEFRADTLRWIPSRWWQAPNASDWWGSLVKRPWVGVPAIFIFVAGLTFINLVWR
jgi:hypothetical protein